MVLQRMTERARRELRVITNSTKKRERRSLLFESRGVDPRNGEPRCQTTTSLGSTSAPDGTERVMPCNSIPPTAGVYVLYGIRNAFLLRPISYLAGHSESVVLHSPQGLWHIWKKGCRAICIIETDATIPHEIFSRMGGDTGDIDLVVHPERDCPLSSRLPRTWPHGALIIFSPSPWAEILQYSIQDAFLHSLGSVFACAHRNKGKIPVHTVSYLCPEGQYSVADRPRAHFYPGKSFESRNYSIAPIILNPYTRACIPASIKVLQ